MVGAHQVVALSELHQNDALVADTLFFRHIPGTAKFFGDGMAFVVRQAWATQQGISQDSMVEIVPTVAYVLKCRNFGPPESSRTI